ncbi:nitrogenase molybdenum-iron protein NifN [Candidatus Magnetomoraceae bacterium gMMP-15]
MQTEIIENIKIKKNTSNYVSTTNACKLCKPLGAAIAFRGIEGAVPFLHGSQGCATYMRRYLISHFREPIDIASSSLGEKHAVYGGGPNLKQGIENVIEKYNPELIGIASTCLTETIGDDLPFIVKEFRKEFKEINYSDEMPHLVTVSTPSYAGTHTEGFHAAVRAIVDQLAAISESSDKTRTINLLPGFISPADLRYLREIIEDFGINGIILPDISDTLDGSILKDYEKIPAGGTPISSIKAMGSSAASIAFGRTLSLKESGAQLLEERFGVPAHHIGLPIGLRETDRFYQMLKNISGNKIPESHVLERGRLVDAYVDGHKYIFGQRAIVYGEEDMVVALTAFLSEIGIKPVLCASGGKSGRLGKAIKDVTSDLLLEAPIVHDNADFYDIFEKIEELKPDLLIGYSKGYHLARKLNIPLIRVGFPIHDRVGAQRVLHIGYSGTQALFDKIVNAVIEKKQQDSPVGYGYI